MEVTVLTWNVQGSKGLDVEGAAGVIRSAGAEVVLLQEVQRAQCRRLAAALDMSWHWVFKHVSLLAWPEGGAVLSRHGLADRHRVVVRRSLLLTWRRRIAAVATVEHPGGPVPVASVHLSPGGPERWRAREAGRLVRRLPSAVIAGDLNGAPGTAGPASLVSAGWVDAWAATHAAGGGGETNWSRGPRLGRAPTRRIDYVMVPPGWAAASAEVGVATEELDWFAGRSDHLPVHARIAPAGTIRAG